MVDANTKCMIKSVYGSLIKCAVLNMSFQQIHPTFYIPVVLRAFNRRVKVLDFDTETRKKNTSHPVTKTKNLSKFEGIFNILFSCKL